MPVASSAASRKAATTTKPEQVPQTVVGTRRVWCAGLGGWLVGCLGLWVLGCGDSRPEAKAPTQPPVEPLRTQPLEGLVIGAGLRWLVLARPGEVLDDPILQPAISRLVPKVRRQVFHKLTGIDLNAIREAIVAGYDDSTLFILDGMTDALRTEEVFRDRLIGNINRKVYRPDAIWTWGTTAAGDVRAVSALAPSVVVVEGGRSLRSKVALLLALGKLRRSPRALDLPDMAFVLEELGDVPLRALAPGPFEEAWQRGMRGLLGVSTAVGVGVGLEGEGSLALSVRLTGAWDQDASRAVELLLASWEDLTRSPLGRMLHLHDPLDAPSTRISEDVIGFDVRIDGAKLLRGLYEVVAADLEEIMDLG